MKKFFLNLLSSFVGAWIALVLFGVVAVIVVIALIANIGSGSSSPEVKRHSVLELTLSGAIEERETAEDFSISQFIRGDFSRAQTLDNLVKALEEGAENKNIDALYLKCEGVSASPATLNALRNAIVGFKKKSSKPIYAYADEMSQADYYVASVADSIFVNPHGMLSLMGIGGYTPYMKGLFDKLGVSFQVVKVGTYKSAVEPYILEKMSEPARAQLDTLYNDLWVQIKDGICSSRKGVTSAQIDSLVSKDFITYKPMEFVLSAKLIDGLCYEREMSVKLASAVGVDKDDLNLVDPSLLVSQTAFGFEEAYSSKKQIAVLYATGEIDGAKGGIQSKKLVPQILELAEDDNVKGLVLRVNSPGGSAFGSEQIWDALQQFKKTGKPFAVSMGDYAASGGYYISCGADRIFANAMTITGSIGIFAMFPEISDLVSNKLGVNMEFTGTNPDAAFPSMFATLSERQRQSMQNFVDNGYELFVSRCAAGRKTTPARIKSIGEGRVWSAQAALRHGLIDAVGSLDDAVNWVAEKSGESDWDVVAYPKTGNSFMDVMQMLEDANTMVASGGVSLLTVDPVAAGIYEKIFGRKPVQALMPELIINI